MPDVQTAIDHDLQFPLGRVLLTLSSQVAQFHAGLCRPGVSFTSAMGLLAPMAEAQIVETALALELLGKLQRFGRMKRES